MRMPDTTKPSTDAEKFKTLKYEDFKLKLKDLPMTGIKSVEVVTEPALMYCKHCGHKKGSIPHPKYCERRPGHSEIVPMQHQYVEAGTTVELQAWLQACPSECPNWQRVTVVTRAGQLPETITADTGVALDKPSPDIAVCFRDEFPEFEIVGEPDLEDLGDEVPEEVPVAETRKRPEWLEKDLASLRALEMGIGASNFIERAATEISGKQAEIFRLSEQVNALQVTTASQGVKLATIEQILEEALGGAPLTQLSFDAVPAVAKANNVLEKVRRALLVKP